MLEQTDETQVLDAVHFDKYVVQDNQDRSQEVVLMPEDPKPRKHMETSADKSVQMAQSSIQDEDQMTAKVGNRSSHESLSPHN